MEEVAAHSNIGGKLDSHHKHGHHHHHHHHEHDLLTESRRRSHIATPGVFSVPRTSSFVPQQFQKGVTAHSDFGSSLVSLGDDGGNNAERVPLDSPQLSRGGASNLDAIEEEEKAGEGDNPKTIDDNTEKIPAVSAAPSGTHPPAQQRPKQHGSAIRVHKGPVRPSRSSLSVDSVRPTEINEQNEHLWNKVSQYRSAPRTHLQTSFIRS